MGKAGETDEERKARERLERIAAARADLAARYAADPAGVARFNLRMARLQAARKREQERFDHLVMGKPRPTERVIVSKGRGRRKRTVTMPVALDPEIERQVIRREDWSNKQGTPETHAAALHHHDALVQLERNGTIDKEQLEWAAEIANVYRSIQADVAVTVASLEARVDQSRSNAGAVEGIRRVRMHLAYGYWREALLQPKQLVLDMIVGDPIGYSVAATRYGVHNRKAKRRLLEAIDAWPACVERAHRLCSETYFESHRDAA